MKKIAFIAHGPGTANALSPLIKPLREKFDVELFPFHPYAAKLWNAELCLRKDFRSIFLKNWDLIVTGTSSLHYVEKMTPIMAREFEIPVVSILELWGNYRNRYVAQPPDFIIALDEVSKREILATDVDCEEVVALGNPHFDRLKSYVSNKVPSIPSNVVFFSQPIDNSKEAFYYLLKLKEEMPSLFQNIYATPHPREDETWLKEACLSFENVHFSPYFESFELMLSCDVTYGYRCSLQYESMIIQKPTIFYESYQQIKKDFLELPLHQSKAKVITDFRATEKCITYIANLLEKK